MHGRIICNCGKSLGELFGPWRRMTLEAKMKKNPEILQIPASLTMTDEKYQLAFKDILDDLGLHADCCRMIMLGTITFNENLYRVN